MNSKCIGIIGAMQIEVDALAASLTEPKKTVISGVTFVDGILYGHRIVCAVSGIGKVFAAICTEAMILNFHPDFIINTGVGGGLDMRLKVADVAIASDLVQHDMDTSPIGDPKGLLSGINLVHLEADKTLVDLLVAAAQACGVHTVTGTIASGDQFINSDAKRKELQDEFGAVACEMEGASVAHVCYVNDVPCGVIRTISDNGDDSSHMDYPAFAKLAAEQLHRIVDRFLSDFPEAF